MVRHCEVCKKKFEARPYWVKRGRARFCSNKCRARAQCKLVERKCQICGKEFKARRGDIKRGWGKFCSRKCQGKARSKYYRGENCPSWRGGKIECICKICGQVFKRDPSLVKISGGRLCSNKCRYEAQRNTVECKCEICGKIFEAPYSHTKNGRGRFCSRKCTDKWQSEYHRGANNPRWCGGKSFGLYGLEFNYALKKTIRARDDYVCAICKRQGNCVHHIDYDKKNNDPQNLITLCRTCHSVTNGNRLYWQDALTRIQTLKLSVDNAAYDNAYVLAAVKDAL